MKPVVPEKTLKPSSGVPVLLVIILLFPAAMAAFVTAGIQLDAGTSPVALWGVLMFLAVLAFPVAGILCGGLKIVRPNEARVFTLFGKYYGTVKESGFYFVNPFVVSFAPTSQGGGSGSGDGSGSSGSGKAQGRNGEESGQSRQIRISLKTQTLNNRKQKVNDALGNPIIIGVVVIWHVENPTQAVFAVENYVDFLSIQTDSTIRNIARLYPYDTFDEGDDGDGDGDGQREKTLRGSSIEIADTMRDELQKRVEAAGLTVEEVRITHLAYAEEIAAAMLQRQQAVAIIAARQKIVDGAVGMVKMAIDRLNEDDVVVLDEERKAAMVSNLLVVLCGNKDAQPIVNSGSIY